MAQIIAFTFQICVQTSSVREETVAEDLFTAISDTNVITHDIEPVMHAAEIPTDSLNMTIPVAIAEYPTNLSRPLVEMEDPMKYSGQNGHSGQKSPVLQELTQPKTNKVKQKQEQKHQTQEISKKLVKALSEKILKRQMSQQAEANRQKECDSVNETAKISATSSTVLNGIPNNSMDQMPFHPVPYETPQRQEVQRNVSVSERIPELPTDTKLSLPSCKSIASDPTPVTAACTSHNTHTPEYIAQQTHAPVQAPLEKVQYAPMPTPVQCVQSMHGTASENASDPVKLQQYLANCGSIPMSHANQNNNHVINNAPAMSVPVHDYYQNANNPYVYQLTPSLPSGDVDREMLLERYIQQQNQYYHEQTQLQYQAQQAKETYSMKSPDSGYNETCSISPQEPIQQVCIYHAHKT